MPNFITLQKMNLTMKFIIYITVMLFSSTTFSQISIDQEIKGKVAGLTIFSQGGAPGTPSYIRIRGSGSFLGGNRPLFVLDGVPLQDHFIGANARFPGLDLLSSINPTEIESVTVLKNAKDVAPYGVRGTNGVIVINTKRINEGPTLRDLLEELNLIN